VPLRERAERSRNRSASVRSIVQHVSVETGAGTLVEIEAQSSLKHAVETHDAETLAVWEAEPGACRFGAPDVRKSFRVVLFGRSARLR